MAANQSENRIQTLGEMFFQLDDDEQLIARTLYRLLANGRPVELEALSRHTGIALTTIVEVVNDWPGVFTNDNGGIIGFWGLAIEPVSTHRFVVDGKMLYAWCAWDTLFMPAHIGKSCQVHASCKHTGEPIELVVSPNGVEYASPETIHLSFVLPDEAAIDRSVVTSFCHFVHFFRDRPAATAWTKDQEGCFVLDLNDAVAAAQHKIAFEFRQLPAAS